MTHLLVGAPVRERTWILPAWLEHLRTSVFEAVPRFGHIKVDLFFVVGQDDLDTQAMLTDWGAPFVAVDEPPHEDIRDWEVGPEDTATRLTHMRDLRNTLLTHVRQIEPDFFLSLDSDMLLHPDALYGMLDCYETMKPHGCWAVGGAAYMDTGDVHQPSFGIWRDPADHNMGMTRGRYEDIRLVDIIMGIKLMDPRAYNIDYHHHPQGEDLGWSEAVTQAGGKLWWDGRTYSKHCLFPEMLTKVDERVGF